MQDINTFMQLEVARQFAELGMGNKSSRLNGLISFALNLAWIEYEVA